MKKLVVSLFLIPVVSSAFELSDITKYVQNLQSLYIQNMQVNRPEKTPKKLSSTARTVAGVKAAMGIAGTAILGGASLGGLYLTSKILSCPGEQLQIGLETLTESEKLQNFFNEHPNCFDHNVIVRAAMTAPFLYAILYTTYKKGMEAYQNIKMAYTGFEE